MRQTSQLFVVTALVPALFLAAGPARAGDFMDTRITWTFGDDDVLHDAGEVVPDSPRPGIGDRKGYELFMDNLNLKTKGRENLTHVALYKKMPGFIDGMTTEAGMVIKLDLGTLSENTSPSLKDVLMDDGSYLRVAWTWDKKRPQDNNVAVVLFPFDTERFRLGYLWDISWGGGNIFTTNKSGPAPGMKVQANVLFSPKVKGYAFAGLKTAKVSQVVRFGSGEGQEITVNETNYGGLFGAGVDLFDTVAIELGTGYFQQGTFPFEGLKGVSVYSAGFSGRLTWHHGLPIQTSIDYMLYRNDPNVNVVEWWREKYQPGRFSASVSVEGTYLTQRLANPDNYASTRPQPAWAGALQAKFKYGYLRTQLVALFRNIEFILQNVPSMTPFVAMPEKNTDTTPEAFFAATFDYYFQPVHLMPYLTAGIQLPASFKTLDDHGNVVSVQVVRDAQRRDRLPAGFDVDPSDWKSWVYEMRAGLKWDVSDFVSLLCSVQYVHDENLTRLVIDQNGERRQFQSPHRLGFSIIARARF